MKKLQPDYFGVNVIKPVAIETLSRKVAETKKMMICSTKNEWIRAASSTFPRLQVHGGGCDAGSWTDIEKSTFAIMVVFMAVNDFFQENLE